MRKNTILAIFIISFILLADQALKLWAKANMTSGEEISILGDWLLLHLVENPIMRLAGSSNQLLIILARVLIIIGISITLRKQLLLNRKPVVIASLSIFIAGLLGNLIDSVFYGIMFNYATLFNGKVVDVLYFTSIKEIVNIADIAIRAGSMGIIFTLVFWSKFYKSK